MILDASVTLSWFFRDEQTPATQSVLALLANSRALVPAHWRLEVGNSLRVAERKGRIKRIQADAALSHLSAMSIENDPETSIRAWADTLSLARAHNLTLYDAAYLELAIRSRLPLATLDKQLRAAAGSQRLPLLGI